MLTTIRTTGDQVAQALRWVSTRGVEVVVEPTGAGARRAGSEAHPTLYVVAEGSPAPQSWSELEDWVRLPVDAHEIYERADRLITRAADAGASWTYVDDDDVLRAGTRLVPLSRIEAHLVRILLDRVGTMVPRDELERALWPQGAPADPRALDNRLTRLRRRLQGLPVEVHTVRGRGFLLERCAGSAERVSSAS